MKLKFQHISAGANLFSMATKMADRANIITARQAAKPEIVSLFVVVSVSISVVVSVVVVAVSISCSFMAAVSFAC